MGVEYVVAYLMTVIADNESPSAADIQEIFESVETDFGHAMTEELICMTDVERLPSGFKEGQQLLGEVLGISEFARS